MKTPPLHYRQGDVLIERIASLPPTAKRQKVKGRIVLAHGEVTGHAHAIHRGKVLFYRDTEKTGALDEVTYLDVQQAVAHVQHEEHSTIPLEPGQYKVTIQREYSPEEIRRVED